MGGIGTARGGMGVAPLYTNTMVGVGYHTMGWVVSQRGAPGIWPAAGQVAHAAQPARRAAGDDGTPSYNLR